MNRTFTFFLLILLAACTNEKSKTEATATYIPDTKPTYLRHVGDSEFNADIDNENFKTCYGDQDVNQYFNFGNGLTYKGEKRALDQYFFEKYKSVKSAQSGWIRIRFIVNCKGETGRFRLMAADENYKEQTFDKQITDQLLELTKATDGWQLQPNEEAATDYYQYLIFKIRNGELIEIMP